MEMKARKLKIRNITINIIVTFFKSLVPFFFFSNWKKYSPLEWEWINRIGDETKL